jgi:hypothetical protein
MLRNAVDNTTFLWRSGSARVRPLALRTAFAYAAITSKATTTCERREAREMSENAKNAERRESSNGIPTKYDAAMAGEQPARASADRLSC